MHECMYAKKKIPDKNKFKKNSPKKISQTKNLEKKNSRKQNFDKKRILKNYFQEEFPEKSQKKWARRAPLIAAEGCSSPQELEKKPPVGWQFF